MAPIVECNKEFTVTGTATQTPVDCTAITIPSVQALLTQASAAAQTLAMAACNMNPACQTVSDLGVTAISMACAGNVLTVTVTRKVKCIP